MKTTPGDLISSRKLISGVLWVALNRGLPVVIALVTTPFLLHHLGVDRWGLFTLALSVAGSFGILDFGIGAALTRALAERIGTSDESEAPSLIIASLVVLLLVGIAGSIGGYILAPVAIEQLFTVPQEEQHEAVDAFRLLAVAAPLIVI